MASSQKEAWPGWFWIWGLVIAILSLLPGKAVPDLSLWDWVAPDKWAHVGVYAVWSYLYMAAGPKQRLFFGLVSMILFGIAMETFQWAFYSDRFFEISDIVANCAGTLLGWQAFLTLSKRN